MTQNRRSKSRSQTGLGTSQKHQYSVQQLSHYTPIMKKQTPSVSTASQVDTTRVTNAVSRNSKTPLKALSSYRAPGQQKTPSKKSAKSPYNASKTQASNVSQPTFASFMRSHDTRQSVTNRMNQDKYLKQVMSNIKAHKKLQLVPNPEYQDQITKPAIIQSPTAQAYTTFSGFELQQTQVSVQPAKHRFRPDDYQLLTKSVSPI